MSRVYSHCIELCQIPDSRLLLLLWQRHHAHSPPPEMPTFMTIDDAYADWYEWRYGVTLNHSMVFPILHTLQGHPKSGRLWEAHINPILHELGFRNTTHDRSIYSATIDGKVILLLHQVDDFVMACPNEAMAKQIFAAIGH